MLTNCEIGRICRRLGSTRWPLRRRTMRGQRHGRCTHARQFHDQLLGRQTHRLHFRRLIWTLYLNDKTHMVAVDLDRSHQIPAHQIAAIRQSQRGERLNYSLLGHSHQASASAFGGNWSGLSTT